ncbi:hypothetical protein IGI04_036116 [Brassica rapa subsp. trilocularis]|uniref:Uncharacterized protein n=1 Tax=Brassica rapa subsp. trilocularis TaxID=1813537 RepID=A0ABQ7LDJ9_BRACM|nr:hypothetical protein IGI04_036116 [Brassica rapa subsp. trilocularis]
MDNEINRRAPLFIENEGARLVSEWAPSAKSCALSATCIPSPFLIGPKSPWPHGWTSQPATDPDLDHQSETRTLLSYSSYLSLCSYKVKSKFSYVRNLLSWPWNACLYVLRLASTFPRTMAVPTILFRIWDATLAFSEYVND